MNTPELISHKQIRDKFGEQWDEGVYPKSASCGVTTGTTSILSLLTLNIFL